jgi:cell division protein FtsL
MFNVEKAVAAALVLSLVLALVSCDMQKGPAERVGQQIDNKIDKAGQQIEKAGAAVRDAGKGDKK